MARARDPRPYYLDDLCPECQAKMRAMFDWLLRQPIEVGVFDRPEPTTTPEATLCEAGISSKRQAKYQRRMSSLLAGRS